MWGSSAHADLDAVAMGPMLPQFTCWKLTGLLEVMTEVLP